MNINLILASHGYYALETLKTAKMIIGSLADEVSVISVTPDKTYDECLKELQDYYRSVEDKEKGVLIFTDIYGGTPANISVYLAMTEPDILVYSGFNLPVLMELLISDPDNLEGAASVIEAAYSIGLVNISKKLKESEENGDQVDSY